MSFTMESVLTAMRELKKADRYTRPFGLLPDDAAVSHFGGLLLIETSSALAVTKERTFPESRHRSARIRKKLIRRHGGEFRMVPAIWRVGNTVYCHPARFYELKRALS